MQSFRESVTEKKPLQNASVYVQSLWHDAVGNWNEAHSLIQDLTDRNAAWIHAYLHRKEGDIGNADYWYSRAEKKDRQFLWLKNGNKYRQRSFDLRRDK